MYRLPLLVALGLLAAPCARATTWYVIAGHLCPEVAFFDANSVTRQGCTVEFWVRTTIDTDSPTFDGMYENESSTFGIDLIGDLRAWLNDGRDCGL